MQECKVFWRWFERNEDRLREIEEASREALFDELLDALHAYSPQLWFETGTADDGVSELIISAEGNADYFSDVRLLIAAAPAIAGWRFLAFKPANGFGFTTEYEGTTFSPGATWFMPLSSHSDRGALGIRVGYAHYDEQQHQRFLTGTFIMLECALGELAFAEQVHHVEVVRLPSSPASSGYLPLTELGEIVK